MIIDQRADQGRMRLSHRLRDFLGIVPEDELDDLPATDTALPASRMPAVALPERPVVIAVDPAPPEALPQPQPGPQPEPAPAPVKRRPVAGPQTAAERAELRDIIAELRDTLDDCS
jgi:hypothetical protein